MEFLPLSPENKEIKIRKANARQSFILLAKHRNILTRLFDALIEKGAKLETGYPVSTYTDVWKYVLEQIDSDNKSSIDCTKKQKAKKTVGSEQ